MKQQEGKWEQRWHPLWREWVVYAAHRNQRPWSGEEASQTKAAPDYDSDCYLCPGNVRVHGATNPNYQGVYIFDNDHPVVGQDSPEISGDRMTSADGLYRRRQADGIARVVCYDPRHNVTLSEMPLIKVTPVFIAWREQVRELQQIQNISFVHIFENKGEIVGVSNPHPHCQIYSTNFCFKHVERELQSAEQYKKETGQNLFTAVIEAEQAEEIRIIAQNDYAIAFIPFFARYAYEILIFPKRRHANLITMSDEELNGMASVFQEVTRRFDTLFSMRFPYVMSILQSPVDDGDYGDYHLHFLIQPPLRQPGLQKYLAGPEIGGGNFMADTMPEEKAAELRAVDLTNFQELE